MPVNINDVLDKLLKMKEDSGPYGWPTIIPAEELLDIIAAVESLNLEVTLLRSRVEEKV